jgi:tripartite-type tricarboxylate transporter receptor subunit TctC
LNDLVAGQIDLILDQASNSMAQVRAGTIKAYAVTAKTRLPSLPEIPTVDEAGAPGLYISVWYGLWVPKGKTCTNSRTALPAICGPTTTLRPLIPSML